MNPAIAKQLTYRDGRIQWTHESKLLFADLWNRTTPRKTADEFGMSLHHACVTANRLRGEGLPVVRRTTSGPVELSTGDRALLDAALGHLCKQYETSRNDVCGHRQWRDGRMNARRALAYAAHYEHSLSLKQVGIYLNRPHPTVAFYCKTASESEREQGANALKLALLVESK